MAKLTNVRERVHQPFRDTLFRTAGYSAGSVQDRTDLFTQAGKTDGETNLKNGSTLPSDQSMVILAVRVFVWYRPSQQRASQIVTPVGGVSYPRVNGDYRMADSTGIVFIGFGDVGMYNVAQAALANGQAPGNAADVLRLYWQTEEQLLWSVGAGDKFSISSMPTAYFPYGGGLHGQGPRFAASRGVSPGLIMLNNGSPDHRSVWRIARAIIVPPRQNLKVTAQVSALPSANAATFGAAQGSRNMLSLTDNLNAVDLVNKHCSLTLDGLFSRDVQ